ncbi:tRNA-dependent cyclodipeptide synthase [Streptomyces aureocirculatus]|uniref:tRNA-dependent cyclodipeptide synthase n=1 Tax=Streptomyces aureocirculatus TaxID=67275 RepID=UPI00099C14B9|nr:tRNA-dependent cyclodipeptide synthase [Streptomyces aureocirculatus]
MAIHTSASAAASTHTSAPAAASTPTPATASAPLTAAAAAGGHTPLPYTPNCRRLLRDADHLLIGVSPGNGYFSIPTLTRVFRWAHATFQRVDVIVPDRSLASNYRAQGYPDQAAHKKARTEVSCVRRRIRRAFERSEIPGEDQHTHLLSDLAQSDAYQRLHLRVRDALTTDERTHAICRKVSARAVPRAAAGSGTASEPGTAAGSGEDGRAKPGGTGSDAAALALEYLIDELPFFMDTPSILGVSSSLVSYHAPVGFADLLYTGAGPLHAAANQGFVLLKDHAAQY